MANLFDKAKKTAGVKPAKGKAKDEVVISSSADFAAVKRLAELQEKIAALESEKAMVYGDVKQLGIDSFAKKYTEDNKYTGSFKIVVRDEKTQDTAVFQFQPTDKYIKIDEAKAEALKEKYGETVIAETTTYTLDTEIVNEYGQVISELIENCKEIPDFKKAKLINAETKLAVKKGSISEFRSNDSMRKHEVSELVNDLQPIFQVKGAKVEVAEAAE